MSVTVKAFLSADLPIELIELLEKVVIEPSPFSDNRNLQNLLLLTAIRADKGKVVGYIHKLQNYDAGEIAKIATDHALYEEALTIYKKYEEHAMAINVLVEHIVSIDRGLDYANKVNKPEVWSRLAKAQLDGLRIKDAIGGLFVISRARVVLDVVIQTRISRLRTPPTSLRSLKSQATLESTMTSFASSKWLARHFANLRLTRNSHTHMLKLIVYMTWRTSWP